MLVLGLVLASARWGLLIFLINGHALNPAGAVTALNCGLNTHNMLLLVAATHELPLVVGLGTVVQRRIGQQGVDVLRVAHVPDDLIGHEVLVALRAAVSLQQRTALAGVPICGGLAAVDLLNAIYVRVLRV